MATELQPPLSVREYTPADWPMLESWLGSHSTSARITAAILPPVGVIVEREGKAQCALWCHLSVGVGMAFVEAPISRPGLALHEVMEVFKFALDAIEEICRTHGYGLLIANTLPGIARFLTKSCGWHEDGQRTQVVKLVLNHGR